MDDHPRLTSPPARGRRAVLGALAALVSAAATFLVPTVVEAREAITTRAGEVPVAVHSPVDVDLPLAASHLALYWAGNPEAVVTVALADTGAGWRPPVVVERDEVGEQRGDGITYGAVMLAGGATRIQVAADRPIGRLTVLAMADGDTVVERRRVPVGARASVAQPSIVSRAGWKADESLRFRGKKEIWPPQFHPVQKLIVHHTATQNGDPDPAATIRSIYRYHAVTQRWGDIGYNFLIDEAGTVYKGRHSHTSTKTSPEANDDTIDGEDGQGRSVTAAHAAGFNSGTVGVALLGTLSSQLPTSAAEAGLVDVLAWKAGNHGLDPRGAALYTNPVNGDQRVFPNIAGHRDVSATECPGQALYDRLPGIREAVALRLGV